MSLHKLLPHLLLGILITITGTTLTTYSITTSYYHIRRPVVCGIIGGIGGLLVLVGLGYLLFNIIRASMIERNRKRRKDERRLRRNQRVRGGQRTYHERDLELGRSERPGPPRSRPRPRVGSVGTWGLATAIDEASSNVDNFSSTLVRTLLLDNHFNSLRSFAFSPLLLFCSIALAIFVALETTNRSNSPPLSSAANASHTSKPMTPHLPFPYPPGLDKEPTQRLEPLNLGCSNTVMCWPSVGGITVIERVHSVELDLLGLDPFNAVESTYNTTEEDEFCRKLRLVGGKWWKIYIDFTNTTQAVERNLRRMTPEEEQVLYLGWLKSRCVWVIGLEDQNIFWKGFDRARNAHMVEERCMALEMSGLPSLRIQRIANMRNLYWMGLERKRKTLLRMIECLENSVLTGAIWEYEKAVVGT
ncbi:uncharacterized protein PAC_08184 [Phialocephala subalpina]|uniref:Uncharacterized protein n=1 Tax=Phialocephala subalpina TaxID=576137 RepID=A0A1L7WZW2_9HELO|nr:uncharacterized protein PAC_08184 [Phialocephala subalpina]